ADARRYVDVELPRRKRASASAAGVARLLGDAAIATARVANDGPHDLTERRLRDGLELARTLAARAGLDRRPGLRAVAGALLAAVNPVVGDLERAAGRGLGELDR